MTCGRLNDPASSPHLGDRDPTRRDPCAMSEHILTGSGGWGVGVRGTITLLTTAGQPLEEKPGVPTTLVLPLLLVSLQKLCWELGTTKSFSSWAAGVNRPSGGHLLGLGWRQAAPGQLRSEQ